MPPARGSLVAILLVIVVEKFASSPNAAANSFNVSNAAGAEATRFDTSVSTYPFVAASFGLVGVVRFVIVPVVPASMFNVPLMVTSLNVDDPVVAVTLPVIPPVRLPCRVPFIATLLKVDVPEEAVTLPATLPVRSPVNPLEAETVVPAIEVAFVLPITTPLIEPLLPEPPTVTEPRVEVVEFN